MFHIRTKQILATLSICALSALPIQAHANEAAAPVIQAQVAGQNTTFSDLKHEAKAMVSETKYFVADLEKATDRLQDRVSPAGQTLKTSLKTKLPGASLLRFADRTFTVFGLMLMMSFAFVVFLLSLSSPMSRTGGRH